MAEGTAPATTVHALALYLRAHPHASDTLEGIRLWWLEPGVDITMRQLQAVIDALLEQGVIEAVHSADGRCRYRRIVDDAGLDRLLRSPPRG